MNMLTRAAVALLALCACAPAMAADPNIGKPITAFSSSGLPATGIYCADANGLTVACPFGGFSAVATGTFTRPANTTAYASGQLIANSTTAASVVPVTIAGACRVAGGGGSILGVRLSKASTTLTGASFRVHFFKTSPAVSIGDGGTFAGGVGGIAAIHIGYVDVTTDVQFSDGAKGEVQPARGALTFDCASGSTNIFAVIEARAAYTPDSGGTFTVAAEVAQN